MEIHCSVFRPPPVHEEPFGDFDREMPDDLFILSSSLDAFCLDACKQPLWPVVKTSVGNEVKVAGGKGRVHLGSSNFLLLRKPFDVVIVLITKISPHLPNCIA